jgi:flagellar hook-associated protein 1 FlgK
MARSFADRVNQLLTSGYVAGGDPPEPGVALFQYLTTDDTHVAHSLAVDETVLPGQLAAINPGPPQVFNSIPLALSQLGQPQSAADKVDGMSYSAFYGSMAARAGSALNFARDELGLRQSTVAQAKELRQQMSGVSLDEEATIMIQFQRAYEANSRLITVLNQMAEELLNILR